MHFVPQFQCFELFSNFFQKLFFSSNLVSLCQFRLIQPIFQSIEILLNCLRKPLFVSIDRNCFSINQNCFEIVLNFLTSLCLFRSIETVFRSIETRESSFKKFRFDLFKTLFQNFSKLFSLSPTRQGSIEIFLSFSSNFLARILSP